MARFPFKPWIVKARRHEQRPGFRLAWCVLCCDLSRVCACVCLQPRERLPGEKRPAKGQRNAALALAAGTRVLIRSFSVSGRLSGFFH